MNEFWQGLTFGSATLPQPSSELTYLPLPLAQFGIPGAGQLFAGLEALFIWNIIFAIAILVIGYIVAKVISAIVERLLKKTDIDNRLAAWITGTSDPAQAPPVERWIGGAVFWLIMIFVVVAFLERLQLTVVSQPLNRFLDQVLGFLPRLGAAAILLAIAWFLATIVKLVVTRGLRALNLDRRLGQQMGDESVANQNILSDTLASALYWFIFLLFLPSILSTLGLEGTLLPVQALLNDILLILPRLLAAAVIIGAGWLVATVVRRIVTNLLLASGVDRIGSRFGISQASGGQSLSWLAGTIVFVLILIPFGIAALNALQIAAITVPAVAMLTQVLNAVPLIFTAAVVLLIAYVIGRFVAELVTSILAGIGFNNLYYWLGLQSQPYVEPTPPPPPAAVDAPIYPDETFSSPPPSPTPRTQSPSEIVGIIVLIAIMLFATITATEILGLAALTLIITGILQIAGQVLVGLVIFAIGLYLANVTFRIITSSGNYQARVLGQTARIAILTLVGAMALQQMGIASSIVNLAFGLLLGAIAVAIALAFGLGGREVAADQIREWLSAFKQNRPPR